MAKVLDFLRREPQAVYTFIVSVVVLLLALGIAIPTGPVMGVVAAALALCGGAAVRQSVTPEVSALERETEAAASSVYTPGTNQDHDGEMPPL